MQVRRNQGEPYRDCKVNAKLVPQTKGRVSESGIYIRDTAELHPGVSSDSILRFNPDIQRFFIEAAIARCHGRW